MSLLDGFERVSPKHRCPICDGIKGCLVSKENPDDPALVICVRIESEREWGEAGFLHIRKRRGRGMRQQWEERQRRRTVPLLEPPAENFYELALLYLMALTDRDDAFEQFAASLGLEPRALDAFSMGWSTNHKAWTAPMYNEDGRVIGISLRNASGRKWMVSGSRLGLFLPERGIDRRHFMFCEGLTDAAALFQLRLRVAGRPSNIAGKAIIVKFVRGHRPERITVFADNDRPGRSGAMRIASAVRPHCPDVRIVCPPSRINDVREWVNHGATRQDVLDSIESSPLLALSIRRKGGH